MLIVGLIMMSLNWRWLNIRKSVFFSNKEKPPKRLQRSLLSHLCWFDLLHVWFWLSSPLADRSTRPTGCFFPVVVLRGVVTSWPDSRPGDSRILDLWLSPEAFWLIFALAFSLPELLRLKTRFRFFLWRKKHFCGLQPSICSGLWSERL